MSLTAWIDVAIGLTLIYLGASLFVTVINEYIAQALNLRGKQLCQSLKTLIDEGAVRNILVKSPAFKPFFDNDLGKAPSYVDPNVLARMLIGGLTVTSVAGDAAKQASEAIDKLPASNLKTQLQAIVRTAGNTSDTLVAAVSDWVNRSLSMLGEGYKRNLQKISLGIGLAMAIGFNLDTIALTEHLYRDKDAREAAVALGVQIAEKTSAETFKKCMELTPQNRKNEVSCMPLMGLVDAVQGRNSSLGKLPIGWPIPDIQIQGLATSSLFASWPFTWIIRTVGWVLTALALSLGAPFWFDLLNKLVNVRYGMRKPDVKSKTQSR
ncbi:MAG: hypothetical protein H8K03_04475 [Nitrospira sp.]